MNQSIEQFLQRRFGIFIHWGVYSSLGGRWQGATMPVIGEWAQAYFRIPNQQYQELAAVFNPVEFDADRWMAQIAAAGAKYIVFTAKHHDGFAMYDSKVDSYNIVETSRFGRDPLRELADACAKYGVGLGIYYSQNLDWHDPDGRDPGAMLPPNCNVMSWGNDWDYPETKQKDFQRFFRRKCLPQVRELLTQYGPVCEFWCDCAWGMTDAESLELRNLIHSLQPDCVINSRIGNARGDIQGLGDNQNMHGQSPVPIESPITLNDTWGFKFDDHNWKSARHIAERLASLAERNANLLLNIGPMGDGRFPLETVRILEELSAWMSRHPGVIVGSQPNPFPAEFPWGYCTQTGKQLHFFVRDWLQTLDIPGISGQIIQSTVPYRWDGSVLTLIPGAIPSDPLLPVISVEFAQMPVIDPKLLLYGNGLELSPCSGHLVLGEDETVHDTRLRVDVASEVQIGSTHMRLERDGTVGDWHNPADRITWDIRVLMPGLYQVEIVTTQNGHGAPWVGGRTVEIEWSFNNTKLSGQLKDPIAIVSPCYPTAQVVLGELDFPHTGEGVLSCRTAAFSGQADSFTMNLTRLILKKK